MARKRTSLFSAPPAKKRKTSKEDPQETIPSEKPCRFLQLSAELRNEIYALVCGGKNEKAHLVARSRGNLAHRSSLARVNEQVRDEFLSVLCMIVPNINVQVKDFNFSHVVAFYNKCHDIELKTLPTTGTARGSKRKMLVTLEVTENTHNCIDGLRRWVNRSAQPHKHGSSLPLQYRVMGGSQDERRDVMSVLNGIHEATEDERKLKVLKDVMKAMASVIWPPPALPWFFEVEDEDDSES